MNPKYLVGKTDNNGKWLSLLEHLRDTAAIMDYLVREWVSDSIVASCKLDYNTFRKSAIFVAAVHDCGKASAYFQGLITEKNPYLAGQLETNGFVLCRGPLYRGKTPHASAGQWILNSILGVRESVAYVVGAHHGDTPPRKKYNGTDNLLESHPENFYGREKDHRLKELWENAWSDIVEEGLAISGFQTVQELPELAVEAQIILSGLLMMADWIASNTYYFPLHSFSDEISDEEQHIRSKCGWSRLKLSENWESVINRMNEELFAQRFHFVPNDIQRAVFRIANNLSSPGILIIEAQMGCGKTEAALGAAEVIASKCHSKGIFFGLPTQATCNGIYDRLYTWAESVSEDTVNSIQLAHGGAMYDKNYYQQILKGRAAVDEEESDDGMLVHPWLQGNKRSLLADFVIGTVDQFLLASLRKKHFALRHLGLAGKVVIIDEAHAYDAYMNEYLMQSLEWMGAYGVPVILLSATLPSDIRTSFVKRYLRGKGVKRIEGENVFTNSNHWETSIGYPLLTWTDGVSIHQEEIIQHVVDRPVKIGYLNSRDEVVAILRDKLCGGGCACIILNTVLSAQTYYNILKEAFPNYDIIIYHSQFTLEDRLAKEKNIRERMGKWSKDKERNGVILVGTQVLEQSLDYDADIMFSELCPMDLLLQRMGREHRHFRSARPQKLQNPEFFILLDEEQEHSFDNGSKKIYGDYLLIRTLKLLPSIVHLPNDISSLVQAVYDERRDPSVSDIASYAEAKKSHQDSIAVKEQRAKTFILSKPRKDICGMLDNLPSYDDEDGYRSVRDSDSTIEVLLLRRDADGVRMLNTDPDKKAFQTSILPEEDECIEIARQRIRLPRIFGQSFIVKDIVNELERKQEEISIWKQSPWLRGELIFLLDSDSSANLCGYKFVYDSEIGLRFEKGE